MTITVNLVDKPTQQFCDFGKHLAEQSKISLGWTAFDTICDDCAEDNWGSPEDVVFLDFELVGNFD